MTRPPRARLVEPPYHCDRNSEGGWTVLGGHWDATGIDGVVMQRTVDGVSYFWGWTAEELIAAMDERAVGGGRYETASP